MFKILFVYILYISRINSFNMTDIYKLIQTFYLDDYQSIKKNFVLKILSLMSNLISIISMMWDVDIHFIIIDELMD